MFQIIEEYEKYLCQKFFKKVVDKGDYYDKMDEGIWL